ncbi:MAG: hypothetical protein LBU73_07535 [Helicobacteraceae bacterium]|jgi:hypothetical protein|nr:hypothetical protein [Helicobacteraceae bacterium]
MRYLIGVLIVILIGGCAPKSRSLEDLGSCYGYGCEWNGRANAVVTFARVVEIRGDFLRQDVELILDDGRVFSIYDYTDREAFRIGDRVRIDYRFRKARKITRYGTIYNEWGMY